MADRLEAVQAHHPIIEQTYREALTTRWVKAYGSIVLVITFIFC